MSPVHKLRDLALGVARGLVKRRLGGYRVQAVRPDPSRPSRLSSDAPPKAVAVLGGGLAGLTAAEALARRGLAVSIFERQSRLGGKVGGDFARDPDGREVPIDHGFHAFFRHYTNLIGLLDRAKVPPMRAIEDYVIVSDDGERAGFGEIETTPLLNVLSLASQGAFHPREVSGRRTRTQMHELLQYDPVATFRDLDHKSFADFADEAALPPKLRRIFATFGRAFFAEEHRLSAAELVRAFHFYYLSHDDGLLYDYPVGDAETALVAPLTRHLERLGVSIHLGQGVGELERDGERVRVGASSFDYVVIATPAMAARDLLRASPSVVATVAPTLTRLERLERGARYAVLRLWLDRDPCGDGPVFISTDRIRLLDAVASYHRITEVDRAWAAARGGAVLELHSYAVPDGLPDDEVERAMVDELARFYPAAGEAKVLGSHMALRDDFTARHVGLAAHRPPTKTDDPRIVLAGDWVSLPIPALLMEGACASGLFAANAVLDDLGLSPEPIWSVPLRGALARGGQPAVGAPLSEA